MRIQPAMRTGGVRVAILSLSPKASCESLSLPTANATAERGIGHADRNGNGRDGEAGQEVSWKVGASVGEQDRKPRCQSRHAFAGNGFARSKVSMARRRTERWLKRPAPRDRVSRSGR